MDELVIFSSPLMCIVVGCMVLLHIISAIPNLSAPGDGGKKKNMRILVYSLSALNAILHVGLFAWALVKGASPEELLLAVMISAAVGIVATGISEKRNKTE